MAGRKYFLNHAKQELKNYSEFNITIDDIKIPIRCPIFNILIKLDNHKLSIDSPSVDRIDNAKGYTKDNIIIVAWKANHLKGHASPNELLKISEFYRSL